MADMNYVSPLTSDLTDYYTKSEVDELQQGDAATYATSAEIVAGDNAVKGWVASQGFLTEHQDLTNYATISYVDDAIAAIEPSSGGMAVRVVNTLPAVGEENVLYLVFVDNEDEENRYAEYIWSDTLNGYEMLGYGTGEGVMPDLTNYATKSYVDTAVGAIVVPDVSDFIDAEKAASIAADEVEYKMNTLSTVAVSGSYDDLTDKPTIPAAPDLSSYATKVELSAKANSADLAAVATTGSYNDLTNKPAIPTVPANVSAFTNDAGYLTAHQDISGKANTADLATVAFSGDYDDLANKPSIPSTSGLASESYVDAAIGNLSIPTKTSDLTNDSDFVDSSALAPFAQTADLSTVATSGSYNDLTDKPTIPATPDLTPYATKQELTAKADAASLATVATTGDYADLISKPEIDAFDELIRTVFFVNSIYNTGYAERTAQTKDELIDLYNKGYIVRLTSDLLPLTLTLSDLGCQEQAIGITEIKGINKTFGIQNTSSSSGIELQARSYLLKISNSALYVFIPKGGQTVVDLFRLAFKGKLYFYNNTNSGLTATTIQNAIDELAASIPGTPTLATVATSGDYDDLINKPTLFSGDYNDLTNKPTIPSGGGGSSVGWSYDSSTGYMTFTGMNDENL